MPMANPMAPTRACVAIRMNSFFIYFFLPGYGNQSCETEKIIEVTTPFFPIRLTLSLDIFDNWITNMNHFEVRGTGF
jgi:hypothetical protein